MIEWNSSTPRSYSRGSKVVHPHYPPLLLNFILLTRTNTSRGSSGFFWAKLWAKQKSFSSSRSQTLFSAEPVTEKYVCVRKLGLSRSSGSSQSSQKMFRRSGRSCGNASQTIPNDPDRFKIYSIVPIVRIVRIELNYIQVIEVVSVVRVVCDRLGNVSIWSSRSSGHFLETTGTIRTIGTIIWKPSFRTKSLYVFRSWHCYFNVYFQPCPLYLSSWNLTVSSTVGKTSS